MRTGGVEVGRLRVHGDGEPFRLRLGVERLLAAADLVGTRLPPAAVLVVRTLRDPLPGRLDVAGIGPDRAWEQCVRDTLDDLVLTAARPAAAPPGANAPAVVFADRAELLACAWRDCLRSGGLVAWWWRALRLDDVRRVHAALAESPRELPGVLAMLERTGDAVGCVDMLTESEALALSEAGAAGFGQADLVAAVAARLAPAWVAPSPLGAEPAAAAGTAGSAVPVTAGAVRHGLPTSLPRAVLVDVCRELAPRHMVAARRAAAVTAPPGPTAEPSRLWGRGPQAGPELGRAATHDDAGSQPAPAAPVAPLTQPAGRGRLEPVVAEHGRSRGSHAGAASPSDMRYASEAPGPPDPVAFVGPERQADLARPGEVSTVVATRLGGVFHLVQVGQVLGLYGDFTTPAEPGIALDVWDFVSLMAPGLGVGGRRDPVWRLLADLAGRDAIRRPGTGYRPPRTWRVPRPWLAPVDAPGVWRWERGPGRQALVHPTGFTVLAGAGLDRDHECARYGVVRCADTPAAASGGLRENARDQWLRHLTAYLRVRLSAALSVPPSRAGRLLCRRPARVHVTATRVDVESELADLPIEVRLAGLDRDLGFVPAAGLTIGFVFR
jgi:hypothetical protein